jgi:3-oxoacyl-[acyl-carrier protein] reductase
MLLQDKVAVVTGSAVGIGREIAIAFGREGARVVVNYSKSADEANTAARAVVAAGGQAITVQANVAADADARALMKRAVEEYGRLDVLVNNAGITRFVPFGDLEGVTDEAWDSLYDVNVKGAFHCARAAAPVMRSQKSGSIINISSLSGLTPTGSSIPYAVSKAAMIHLSACLAKALAPEIRVNSVAPGFVGDTRWYAGLSDYEQRRDRTARSTPLQRAAGPADVVEAVLFFAASAGFITGTVLTVDGGAHLM